MNTKSHTASDATVNSFAAGYKAVKAPLDGLSAAKGGVVTAATVTKDTACGFFSGMMHAIAERRGKKPLAAKLSRDEQRIVDEIKREEAMRAKREFYSRVTESAVIFVGGES